jgi:hypothetical protein
MVAPGKRTERAVLAAGFLPLLEIGIVRDDVGHQGGCWRTWSAGPSLAISNRVRPLHFHWGRPKLKPSTTRVGKANVPVPSDASSALNAWWWRSSAEVVPCSPDRNARQLAWQGIVAHVEEGCLHPHLDTLDGSAVAADSEEQAPTNGCRYSEKPG